MRRRISVFRKVSALLHGHQPLGCSGLSPRTSGFGDGILSPVNHYVLWNFSKLKNACKSQGLARFWLSQLPRRFPAYVLLSGAVSGTDRTALLFGLSWERPGDSRRVALFPRRFHS